MVWGGTRLLIGKQHKWDSNSVGELTHITCSADNIPVMFILLLVAIMILYSGL